MYVRYVYGHYRIDGSITTIQDVPRGTFFTRCHLTLYYGRIWIFPISFLKWQSLVSTRFYTQKDKIFVVVENVNISIRFYWPKRRNSVLSFELRKARLKRDDIRPSRRKRSSIDTPRYFIWVLSECSDQQVLGLEILVYARYGVQSQGIRYKTSCAWSTLYTCCRGVERVHGITRREHTTFRLHAQRCTYLVHRGRTNYYYYYYCCYSPRTSPDGPAERAGTSGAGRTFLCVHFPLHGCAVTDGRDVIVDTWESHYARRSNDTNFHFPFRCDCDESGRFDTSSRLQAPVSSASARAPCRPCTYHMHYARRQAVALVLCRAVRCRDDDVGGTRAKRIRVEIKGTELNTAERDPVGAVDSRCVGRVTISIFATSRVVAPDNAISKPVVYSLFRLYESRR